MKTSNFQNFSEFYPYYLTEHSNPTNRALHFVGTSGLFVILLLAGINQQPQWLIGLPVCGYGFAWMGHFLIEKNRPATFTYPRWSLMGDFRMYFETWRGILGGEGVVIPSRQ